MNGHLDKIQTSEQGFTLFEIAVSIAILGASFATILSLQTSIINAYAREGSYFRAALYAQYMMSVIEADNEEEIQDRGGDLENALTDIGFFDDSLTRKGENLDGWTYEQSVEPVEIPSREDLGPIMERIDLKVSWSDLESDSFNLVYYRKTKPQEGTQINP